ncbi:DUF2897 family protein [Vibrio marisflavi]|uniref:DUF2897 family protein n=1 Tax=Vibrio marisflavi TaxID=1216040 RepID=UPI001F190255|nr:DUF2897 family protein [Vibrio marisflavi]
MIEWLFNPWVIIFVVVSVVAGNIAALKYSAKVKLDYLDKRKSDLDKLNELSRDKAKNEATTDTQEQKTADKTKAD